MCRKAPGVRIPPHPSCLSCFYSCACSCSLTFLDYLQFLAQFHPAAMWQDAAKIYAGVNHASRPITEPGLITELQPISARSPTIAPNFLKPVGISPSGVVTVISA